MIEENFTLRLNEEGYSKFGKHYIPLSSEVRTHKYILIWK